jgi:phage shock protein A
MTNDPELLEEVMELNEKLEDLETEQDWMKFRKENQITFKELEKYDEFNRVNKLFISVRIRKSCS